MYTLFGDKRNSCVNIERLSKEIYSRIMTILNGLNRQKN